jgi:uncharacterized protein YbjQ (UPF0145 family)
MVVNDHRATSSGRGSARHAASADDSRPYAPGSRLRRALDIARGAAKPEPSEPEVAGPEADEQPVGRTTAQPVTARTTEHPVAARTPTRNGLSPDLDAVLPAATDFTGEADTWESSAQGWVRSEQGTLEWRPIVATVDRLDGWQVATYVGVVTGRASLARPHGDLRLEALVRREAIDRMVEEATARGAHGVLGVTIGHADQPDGLVVTVAGTAVTLSHRS